MSFKFMRMLFAGLTAIIFALPVAAADYPERTINLVVPFPPGSSTDSIARILAEEVSRRLAKPIVVINRPGADGIIGANEVRNATPDGYTLFLGTATAMSGVPVLKKSPPYDPIRDFSPITDIGRYAFFLYVNHNVPVSNLKEFAQYVKSQPGKLSYAYGNVTGQLAFASIAHEQKLEILPVGYKGEPPAVQDVMGGLVTAMVATASVGMPHVRSKRLKALATILPTRSPAYPDIPTMVESGFAPVPTSPWLGLFGPARMPIEITSILNRAFVDAMQNPSVLKRMEALQFVLTPSEPSGLRNMVAEQLKAHRDTARAVGIQPE